MALHLPAVLTKGETVDYLPQNHPWILFKMLLLQLHCRPESAGLPVRLRKLYFTQTQAKKW